MIRGLNEIKYCIREILIPYVDCFCWEDFGDKGNPCYDPYSFSSEQDRIDDADARRNVYLAMPKGSLTHNALGRGVAKTLDMHWVTYDWLVKAVGRILAGTTVSDLKEMVKLSELVRGEMRARGMDRIDSLSQLFS